MARKNQILTRDILATIPALIESGKNRYDIANMLGCTPGTLAVKCSIAKISLDSRTGRGRLFGNLRVLKMLRLSKQTFLDLQSQAEARGITTKQLIYDILEIIATDDLYLAVLGEIQAEKGERGRSVPSIEIEDVKERFSDGLR